MAEAQYETRTKTVEETVVVLRLTEGEADTLRSILDGYGGPNSVSIRSALTKPTGPETAAATFEYGGVAYEYGQGYRDQDGDVFQFDTVLSGDGSETPRGRILYAGGTGGWMWSLEEVVRGYGPLTKVTS
ncbi:phiSA1p31-related protein [Streptomyces sp. NPDC090231]|uniref:phiSA1p31-related protein n=1 Tax=unclassified Streptomyces TaxID=2593676 RepID=UPI00382146AA